jgi:hypothetical protein
MRRLRAAIGDAEFAKGFTAEGHLQSVLRMLEERGA